MFSERDIAGFMVTLVVIGALMGIGGYALVYWLVEHISIAWK